MRTNIAIALCVGAVLIEALLVWRTHQVTFSAVFNVAGVWIFTGLWLGGRLRAVLYGSPLYQELRKGEPMPRLCKTIFMGGVLLGWASLLLLFL